MFCYQCEQTTDGVACEKSGACGKNEDVAALQDALIHAVKKLSQIAVKARKAGINDYELNSFTAKAIFLTLTNVNFDEDRTVEMIKECSEKAKSLKAQVGEGECECACACGCKSKEELIEAGKQVGIKSNPDLDENIRSLREMLIYGIKGLSAYADHANVLGKFDDEIFAFIHEGMAATLDDSLGIDELVALSLKCGEVNLKTMEILDAANTGTYGHPVPTKVSLGQKAGKAILISGHDLKDVEKILKLSEGKGINVYSHGEILPAHGYPELNKYSHFCGHYGTAWQNQQREFNEFPGAILMTTNCIKEPIKTYKDNIFTSGVTGWPGVTHVSNGDFSKVIDKALELPGFASDVEGKEITSGFARNAVLGVADKVIDAVKGGAIKHFFVVGGCDGARPDRNYFTEIAEKIPNDCVILTLGCGKFRFFDKELGDIGGIPRLLDLGQCNDSYSAIQIAVALAGAFECDVNDLPLSLIISWYEQKACAVLLSLLYLGIKNIRLGPTLPAFITPAVLDVLVKNFNIMPISTADEDLKAILG